MNASVTKKAVLYSRSRFSWGLSEIGATKPDGARLLREAPAAFGRLCVETALYRLPFTHAFQPPSGGCVLKRSTCAAATKGIVQPPSGGCVLKRQVWKSWWSDTQSQPPSGGCVLKHVLFFYTYVKRSQPPSGGCVLKPSANHATHLAITASRLRAAVC